MKTVKGACDICKREFEGKDKLRLNIAIGLHKRFEHGIKGMTGRERYYVYAKGMTLEEARKFIAEVDSKKPTWKKVVKIGEDAAAKAKRKSDYQREYRRTHPKQTQQSNGSETVAAHLSECPVCHSRFYVVKGQDVIT